MSELKDRVVVVVAGGAAEAVPTDVTDRAQVHALIARAVERLGTIDVLVNNAGVMPLDFLRQPRAGAPVRASSPIGRRRRRDRRRRRAAGACGASA